MRQLICLIFRKRNRGCAVVIIGEFDDAKFVTEVDRRIVNRAICGVGRVVEILVVGIVAHFSCPLKNSIQLTLHL